MTQRLSTLVFTLLFLGAMFGGLFHMTMGMDMTGNMSDCPFMTHEEVLCSMSVFDHLSSWQTSFLAIIPSLLLLLSALVAAVLVFSVAPNLLSKQKFRELSLSRVVLHRIYSYFYRPLQELFSSGILHPKLF